MRARFLIMILIAVLLVPVAAKAVSQETIDQFVFLLQQPEWDKWDEGVFDDATLTEGLDAVYDKATADADDILLRRVIWAMGETALPVFVPTLVESLEDEPLVACFALGKISSEDGVNALIGMLDNDDIQVRDAAAWGLGNMLYTDEMKEVRDDAVSGLKDRLFVEEEDWILEDIQAAITFIETGIAINPAYMESDE